MLQPIVFGLNYQTANFELRNRLAFANEEIPGVLKRLVNSGVVKEVILLSTCNRTELFFLAKDVDFVINSLCDMRSICPNSIRKHSYVHQGEGCAHHLFRVISGLESMVLGETEIVAQIKQAMEFSRQNNTLGSNLSGLFQMALAVEKDVRNHSAINNVAISMGHAVVNCVEKYLPALPNRKVLFVGAGQMMQQIAPHFNYLDLDTKMLVNRTVVKAQPLATKIGAELESLSNLAAVINDYATVVVCCASNVPLIDALMLKQNIEQQVSKLIIDLSMPLVISKGLQKYTNFTLLTVDDIAKLVDVGLEKRKLAAVEAEGIIAGKLADYHMWLRKRGLAPLIKKLLDQSEQIRQESLLLAEKQLLNGVDAPEVLKQLSVQLVNRLLHNPLVNITAADGRLQDDMLELVANLYSLEI